MIENLSFRPLLGLTSPHAQTILASVTRAGRAPPATPLLVPLSDGDTLRCEVSTPSAWQANEKTIIMLHGLSGTYDSNYMVRIGRKLYEANYRVIRVNLRGCGLGSDLARRPYHGGKSDDILTLLQTLNQQTPSSPLILLGFSLGGNIALKLAGELEEKGRSLLHHTIAICPPIDLKRTVELLSHSSNHLYQRYYVDRLQKQAKRWLNGQLIRTVYEFDSLFTAPTWGFHDAADYYQKCSSRFFLPSIRHSCHILFAVDDPFIDYRPVLDMTLHSSVKVWVCPYGGHMGFLGWAGKEHRYFWLDRLIQDWVKDKF
jgi:predicted alpha/beta-fold hydrolase